MTNFDDQVRDALTAAAREVPDTTVAAVRHRHYRAARTSRGARLAIGTSAVAATATALVVALSIGTTAPNAFATWSPTPTPAHAHQVLDAAATCLADVAAQGEQMNTQQSSVAFPADDSDWTSAVTDVRGPFTLVYFTATTSTSSDDGVCLNGGSSWSDGPAISVQGHSAGSPSDSFGESGLVTQSNRGVRSWQFSQGGSSDGSATVPASDAASAPTSTATNDGLSYAIGLVGNDVTGVVLSLSNGTSVTTSVANGYYAAWWPSAASVTGLTVTTVSGSITQPVAGNTVHTLHGSTATR